ncbi:nuclear transport factor 2 family protein [Rhodospirillaceae bacterium SYSU D60015]|uniref:nuclear transport factor 2 family protein n=1 Tax=Desertibaculum subflavum TaxID=2268458 RepID=UPI000E6725A0
MAAIAELLTVYFDGLHHSDTSRLRDVFHPDARYVCATEGGPLHLDMEAYFAIVDQRPSPASRGEARSDRILGVELAGPVTALARVQCSIGPKLFTDFLSLIHVDGRWRIICKVFHFDLRA